MIGNRSVRDGGGDLRRRSTSEKMEEKGREFWRFLKIGGKEREARNKSEERANT